MSETNQSWLRMQTSSTAHNKKSSRSHKSAGHRNPSQSAHLRFCHEVSKPMIYNGLESICLPALWGDHRQQEMHRSILPACPLSGAGCPLQILVVAHIDLHQAIVHSLWFGCRCAYLLFEVLSCRGPHKNHVGYWQRTEICTHRIILLRNCSITAYKPEVSVVGLKYKLDRMYLNKNIVPLAMEISIST